MEERTYQQGGELLGAHIADDGQWRFPPCDTVPEKYARALILFEDQYFYYRPGVNPVAMGKALVRNIKAGHIVNGGSTIAMQVMRMAKSQGKSRNVWQKIRESYGALCIGTFYSKHRLLSLYASNAPFGGNVVGIDAAAWRYFGHDASNLSWAESALLAVLPNSPSSIHIARNRKDLAVKRNRLLARLHKKGYISDSDYSLSKRLRPLIDTRWSRRQIIGNHQNVRLPPSHFPTLAMGSRFFSAQGQSGSLVDL